MKDKLKRIGSNVANQIIRAKNTLAGAAVVAMTSFPMITNAKANSADSMVETVAGTVVDIFPLIGAFFVIAGVFKLVMAYRNDQPEGQAAAAKDIVIGAVFIFFKVFIWETVKGAIF